MLYYFSGTGNTRFVAQTIGDKAGIAVYDIRHFRGDSLSFPEDRVSASCLGIASPIYGWTIPTAVQEFIRSLPYADPQKENYVFAILTCGDDIGFAHRFLLHLLADRGYTLTAVWSIIMPNTYVALPFFDVDDAATTARKLAAAPMRCDGIATCVRKRSKHITDVHPGSFAWLKSGWLRYFFYRYLVGARMFSTLQRCTACQKCVIACPVRNIKVLNARQGPQWDNRCTFCLACYHVCPQQNIIVRPFGKNKGQYQHFFTEKLSH